MVPTVGAVPNGVVSNERRRGCEPELTPVVEIKRSSALPDDQHGQDGAGQTEVERHCDHADQQRVLRPHDPVLGEGEENGTKAAGDTGSDSPCCEDLRDTFPGPVDALSTDGSEADTDDTTDDAVSRGDGQADLGREGQEGR